ncbi:uncharacterized protein LOC114271312 [Camellia sinensis]|uniref:uncharacterized protein LOC114271312 n=1 Tax=Camellia sinensis TaxID=4442 RepID=UPI001035F4A4|nr:uncharacterized protein LOC114271312 [Camellia sinensis]
MTVELQALDKTHIWDVVDLSPSKTAIGSVDPSIRLTSLDGDLLSDAILYHTPCTPHYTALLRILRYLKGTLFHSLHYSASSSLELCAFSDANWVGDPTDRRSTTAFYFFLGDSLLTWRNKKKSLTTRSSTEAEYQALPDTTQELL